MSQHLSPHNHGCLLHVRGGSCLWSPFEARDGAAPLLHAQWRRAMATPGASRHALPLLCVLLLAAAVNSRGVKLSEVGGVAFDGSRVACLANGQALLKAFQQADAASEPAERVVIVDAGKNFSFFNATVAGLTDVTLQVDGALVVSDNLTAWPAPGGAEAALYFQSATNLRITGAGVIDGQGYNWWWSVFLGHHDIRPDLVIVEKSVGVEVDTVLLTNSPRFHLKTHQTNNVYVHDMTIYVDTVAQKSMLQRHGHWHHELGIPTFPLNTDGIDPSGRNVTIERVSITNFDDAVAVKPTSGSDFSGNCTQDIYVRDCVVTFGVGMSIGSVPPHEDVSCIRNVTFDNIVFHNPIKALYIKSNPGDTGSGIVEQITYKNIVGHSPLWYPLWIGPQQQQQPGTAGTGCSFLFPIVKACPTQPRVTIRDITVSNATFTGGLTLPGVLLANASNPYTNIVFDNVNNTGPFLVSKEYVCEHVNVTTVGASSPTPSCSSQ